MRDFKIIGLGGAAKSGKDFVADYLTKRWSEFYKEGFADPIKRFSQDVFRFTGDDLWGPSENRGTAYGGSEFWVDAVRNFDREFGAFSRLLLSNSTDKRAFDISIKGWFARLLVEYTKPGTPGTITPRVVLQTLGTEMGRAFDKALWTRHMYSSTIPRLKEGGWAGIVIPDHRFISEIEETKKRGGVVLRVLRPGATKDQTVGIPGHASELEQTTIPDSEYSYVLIMPEGTDQAVEYLDRVFDEQPWKKS